MKKDALQLLLNTDLDVIAQGKPTKRILEVVAKPPEKKIETTRPPLNLAVVLDRSGSMSGNKINYVKQAAIHMLDLLEEQDHLALVVYDDRAIRRYLHAALNAQGYTVYEASGGKEALNMVVADRPDLIILDLGLPDLDGVEVTRQLREWTHIPIIILSVREQESDKIDALDAGADDYLTKPFSSGELMARMRAALRRSMQTASELIFEVENLKVDLTHRQVRVSGEEISLTPTEYDLLRILVQNAGRVLTHRQMLRQVWGAAYEAEAHLLRVNRSNLRRKIEPDATRPRYIITEPGVGYRLKTEA